MADSEQFTLLHNSIKKWIWDQGWTALRSIQEEAIAPILSADRDLIISATTAAGKTEAAFLPACSYLLDNPAPGIGILYISPLKALINDQFRRLESLGMRTGIRVTPWHGDILKSRKDVQLRDPQGILLITPESLESLFINKNQWCRTAFADIRYVIIDEFHAFIGRERGYQLLSILRRLECLHDNQSIPRIALSATIGNIEQVITALRPTGKYPFDVICSDATQSDLKIQLRGYINPVTLSDINVSAMHAVERDLYKILRGRSHLVFANSRATTEELAAGLSDRCNNDGVPNEFFPHHGNLSKELRESLENRLQKQSIPTTAICTMTLELGIDIGHVDSIAQVTAPNAVSSLKQRLGRSGRRGEPAVLRLFICENELSRESHLADMLRLQAFQSIAMINLVLKKWCEPPDVVGYHFSTLIQQTLSVIAQYGSIRAQQLWSLLCQTGPFCDVTKEKYIIFLRSLGERELITQMHDGQIVLGYEGERVVNHYSFYTAFFTPEEYRLLYNGKSIGTIPVNFPLASGQVIIFAGRRWEVITVHDEDKCIILAPSYGGRAPMFNSNGWNIHDMIRNEMFKLYVSKGHPPAFLDRFAGRLYSEGIDSFHSLGLNNSSIALNGNDLYVIPWSGDKIVFSIFAFFINMGITASVHNGLIALRGIDRKQLLALVSQILSEEPVRPEQLTEKFKDLEREKYDSYLSRPLLEIDFAAKYFDIDGALSFLRTLQSQLSCDG